MQVSDKEIALRIRQGDHKAFEMLYDLYYVKLCSYCNSIVKNLPVAEEIVQELIYTVWDRRTTLSFEPELKQYLYRSVYNNAITHVKKESKLAINSELTSFIADSLPRYYQDELETKELSETIENTLSSLPAQTKDIFQMNRDEEMSYKEIAEKTKLSVKSIEYHMSKAIKVLQKELSRYLMLVIFILIIKTI